MLYENIIQKRFFFLVCEILLISGIQTLSEAQIKSIGTPHINNYFKKSYKADRQNWSITQQKNGILYFANNSGVLQFDGTFWNLYPVPNNSIVRSVAAGDNGLMYVGAFDEFGYLKPDKFGNLQYISLSDKLPDSLKKFDEIWKIYPTTEGVYFQSYKSLFYSIDNQVKALLNDKVLGFSFFVNDSLFIRDKKNNKLYAYKADKHAVKKIKNYPTGETIWSFIHYDNEKYLIATESGLYFLKNGKLNKWDTPVSNRLAKNRIFSVAEIDNNAFAIGTVLNGLYVTNRNGKLLQHINKSNGLQNNTVLSIFSNKNHKLWLGLDNGISEIEINSPFTLFGQGVGLNATGYTSIIYENLIYLGTNQGVFVSQWNENIRNFQLLDQLKGQAWQFNIIDSLLFCAHNDGAFVIDDKKVQTLSKKTGCWNFKKIPENPAKIISGTYNGLIVFEKNAKGQWRFKNKIRGFDESSRFLEFDKEGTIWISHGYKGIFALKPENNYKNIAEIRFYDATKGLPGNYANTIYKLNGELIVSTLDGLFTYNKKTDRFIRSQKLNKLFYNKVAYFPKKDKSGNIWFVHSEKLSLLELQNDGSFLLNDTLFNRYKGYLINGFENYNLHDEKNIIIGTEDGFIHYNPTVKVKVKSDFLVFLRQAILSSKYDTVTYDFSQIQEEQRETIKIDYTGNRLKFIFSSPYYTRSSDITYSCKLINFDNKWTEWTADNQKEYTNLAPGKYTFHLKAKNIFSQESAESIFFFEIKPPWFRTIYAYIVYLIIGTIIAISSALYIYKRIEYENKALKIKQQQEFEKKEKFYQAESIKAEQKIIKLKNEKLNAEIQRKNIEFDLKKKELASIALQITHKNEILNQLRENLFNILEKVNNDAKKHLKKLIKSIESENKLDGDWEQFKKHFDEVHGDFFKRLHKNYPELTPKDLKLCAYLRINLSTKEIAPLMNISVRGVEIHRYRLRKKLKLSTNENLFEFMLEV